MIFNAYSAYYDLLYTDKNYEEEALYIHSLIKKYNPQSSTLLDLGCGTGKHVNVFSLLNYKVVGIDRSTEMLDLARLNAPQSIEFYNGDLRTMRLQRKFDVVASLFDVMSYQVEDIDLADAFATVVEHLDSGGLFIFDCWYGPGVQSDPPVVTRKTMQNEKIEVERTCVPSIYPEKNMVSVFYEIQVKEKETDIVQRLHEEHKMRYLFFDEVRDLSRQFGLDLLNAHEWFREKELNTEQCWKAIFVLQKK